MGIDILQDCVHILLLQFGKLQDLWEEQSYFLLLFYERLHSTVVNIIDSEIGLPGFKFWFCHLIAL